MLSSRIQRLSAVGVVSLAMIGAATEAFAIRNKYSHQQAEGFTGLLFDAFGRPGFDERYARVHRRLSDGEPLNGGRGAPSTY